MRSEVLTTVGMWLSALPLPKHKNVFQNLPAICQIIRNTTKRMFFFSLNFFVTFQNSSTQPWYYSRLSFSQLQTAPICGAKYSIRRLYEKRIIIALLYSTLGHCPFKSRNL